MHNNPEQSSINKFVSEVLTAQGRSVRSAGNVIIQGKNHDERYRQLFESSADGICLIDATTGRIEDLNRSILEFFGGRREDYLDKVIWETDLFLKVGLERTVFERVRKNGRVRTKKFAMSKKNGKERFIEFSAEQFGSYKDLIVHCTFRDITHHQKNLQKQEREVNEKSTMLKELQHRAKNTFSLITGLIELKSFDTDSAETETELQELSMRVKSISDLYTLLYETDSYDSVDMNSYFRMVGNSIVGKQSGITMNYQINATELPAKLASSLGIIFVELLYNAMKYAFPGKKKGTVDVCFRKNGEGYFFSVSDNGIGLPEDFRIVETNSSGLHLVQLMATQLNGTVEFSSRNGTKAVVEFCL